MSKVTTHWRSPRLHEEIQLIRWGEVGVPVLVLPTAGGDAEEIERFLMIDALAELLAAGRIKVYSTDSIAGRVLLADEGSPDHQAWVQSEFHHMIRHEVVPAIRTDCRSADIQVISAGSSIGALNALAMLCRYPDAFSAAVCMSGTYDIERFHDGPLSMDLYYSSPLHFLEQLDGEHLRQLRQRFVIFASGEGRWENIGETWQIAHVLGQKGIPNRVDPWGTDWDHDWPTWRRMLPKYLDELT